LVEKLTTMLKKPRATTVREIKINKDFKRKKEITKKKTEEVYFEHQKVGVNMNHVSRAINADIDKGIAREFSEDVLNEVGKVTEEIEEKKRGI
ncbi:hypothetical protein, partial [Serratia marcescens]|uniref:hypothetical protein n=1 Tax=Serratia marcescens TaxID=615 RepID=UPI001BD1BEBB